MITLNPDFQSALFADKFFSQFHFNKPRIINPMLT